MKATAPIPKTHIKKNEGEGHYGIFSRTVGHSSTHLETCLENETQSPLGLAGTHSDSNGLHTNLLLCLVKLLVVIAESIIRT